MYNPNIDVVIQSGSASTLCCVIVLVKEIAAGR